MAEYLARGVVLVTLFLVIMDKDKGGCDWHYWVSLLLLIIYKCLF